MFSEDFRHIARRGEQGRSDRLLRAATTAFCSLTRPTRRDARQLSQLALPLYDGTSIDARRYIAAALSDLSDAPFDLVARLANDRLDVAAPLLKRSPLLRDLDLLSVIARHGLGHARVIARRDRLNPTIASLIRALEASDTSAPADTQDTGAGPGRIAANPSPGKRSRADAIRDQLRSMMQAADNHPAYGTSVPRGDPQDEFDRIRQVVKSRLAPAGRSGRHPRGSDRLFGHATIDDVISAMKSLAIAEDKALLIACSAFPERFSNVSAVSDFVREYRKIEVPAPRFGRPNIVTFKRPA